MSEKKTQPKELSEDQLESVSGGFSFGVEREM
jgi:bacteriocin-like protein